MFKKYFKVLVLLVVILIPSKLFALNDSYFISMTGSYGDYIVDYHWVADNVGSKYLTKDELQNYSGATCDGNDYQLWYYRMLGRIKVNPSKAKDSHGNNYSSCNYLSVNGSTLTHYGKDENSIKSLFLSDIKSTKQNLKNAMVTCTKKTGGTNEVKITESNMQIDYSCGSDEKFVGNNTCGRWAYKGSADTIGSGEYYRTRYVKVKCTTSEETEGDSTKKLPQHSFKTSTGLTAYCINPGKAFINQTHVKTSSFDTSKCKSSTDSYSCALAAAIVLSKKNNYNDMAIQTALRFIAAEYKDGDGIWDGTYTYSSAGIFGNTSNAIRSSGYSGSTSASKGILYASGSNLTILQNAISIYKQVKAGYKMWAPSVKVTSANYSAGTATLYVETNFDASTNIKGVTLSNGKSVNYTKSSCENNSANTCIKITFSASESDIKNCNLKVRINYSHGGDETISRIGMYLPSSNATSYQKMLIYDTSSSDTFVEASLCGSDDYTCTVKDGIYYGKNGTPVDKETYDEECSGTKKTTCPDPGITSDMPDDCSTDGTTGVIKDPNMCTILNSEETVKSAYKKDYGNEYCTVYCNETLTFSFMDKATAISGRYFVHDVSSYYSNKQNLSTVILSTRQCTSLIDYDTWKKDYNNADEKVRTTWNTYKKYESQYNHLLGPITRTQDCSACASSSCCTTAHSHPDDCTYHEAVAADPITGLGGKSAYWSHGTHCVSGPGCATRTLSCSYYTWHNAYYRETNYNGSLTGNINMSGDSSSECTMTCSCSCSGCNDRTKSGGNNNIPSNYASSKSSYDSAVSNRQTLIDKINSCNFTEGSSAYKGVMEYSPQNKVDIDYAENTTYQMDYKIEIANEKTSNNVVSRGYSTSSDWKEICGSDCDGTLSNLGGSSSETLGYWSCSGSETNAKCTNIKVTVPNNKTANIVVNTETIHYQSANFFTQVYTGKVSTEKTGVGYWIELADNDKHLYPVSAYRLTGNYPITVTYSDLGDPGKTRDMQGGSYTCSYDAINEVTKYDCNDGYHICYPDTDSDGEYNPTVGLGLYFRVISLSDIFPSSSYSPTYSGTATKVVRNVGENWITSKAAKVVNEIQFNRDDIWATKEPMYKITLTPTIMKNIRKYNSNTNYLDYSITCNSLTCTSDFLQNNLKNLMEGKYNQFYFKNTSIKSDSLYYYVNK